MPGDLNQKLAESFGLESTKGAIVNEVYEDTPAERGGLKHGDVIIEIDGAPIESARQLRLTVSQMAPGREVQVKVIRDGEAMTFPITLGDLNGTASSGKVGAKELHGLDLEPVDDELRESASIPDRIQGLYVKSLDARSPFADVLRQGVVIIEANGVRVKTREDFMENLRVGINRLYVWYRGSFVHVGVRLNEED